MIDKKSYLEHNFKESETLQNDSVFIVDSPPPNLSGDLHIGHIFNLVQPDFINRFKLLNKHLVIMPKGIDNNGIPTWNLFLKELKKLNLIKSGEPISKQTLETLVKENKIIEIYTEKYKQMWEKACIYFNQDYQYSTLSEDVSKISQASFIDLYKKGDIYKKDWPVSWDVKHQTAVSNMDLITKSKDSVMYNINFGNVFSSKGPLDKSSPLDEDFIQDEELQIVIATTRPELIPGCVAVFYNPDHEMSFHLKGRYIKIPILGTYVPLIADDKVDLNKGTGFVMCSTFGDLLDVYWWNKHGLATKQIITKTGKVDLTGYFDFDAHEASIEASDYFDKPINENIKFLKSINGLKVTEYRAKIVELFEEFILAKKNITHNVSFSERSDEPVEIITMPQWYLKTIKYKEKVLEVAKQINWHPKYMYKKLEDWVNAIDTDWCISRQRPWGINVPIYYDEDNNIVIPEEDELPVSKSKGNLKLDENILDTWATSSLTYKVVENLVKSKLKIDAEVDLRFQAHEIIRTWTFTTILRCILDKKNMNSESTSIEKPWKNIMVTGWCLATNGDKISKSKGNAPCTDSLLYKYGIDSIRYWCAKSKLGNDVAFCEEVVKAGDKFINKIINASKFCFQNFELVLNSKVSKLYNENIYSSKTLSMYLNFNSKEESDFNLTTLDKSFLIKFQLVLGQITRNMNNYEMFESFEILEKFFKSDFCDNYLEIIKKRFYGEPLQKTEKPEDCENGKLSASYTCFRFFDLFLRALNPFMPKLSQFLYQELYCSKIDSWPLLIKNESIEDIASKNAESLELNHAFEIIEEVRKVKSRNKMAMNSPIKSIKILNNYNLDINTLIDIRNASNSNEVKLELDDKATQIKIEVEI